MKRRHADPMSPMQKFLAPSLIPAHRNLSFDPGALPVYREHTDEVVGYVSDLTRHMNEKRGLSFVIAPEHRRAFDSGELQVAFKKNEASTLGQYETEDDFNAKDVRCANCRIHTPRAFTCRRCLSVCYCSNKCLLEFWEAGHKDVCRVTCHWCHKKREGDEPFHKCGRCRKVYYCSPECQRAEWPIRHRRECALNQQ